MFQMGWFNHQLGMGPLLGPMSLGVPENPAGAELVPPFDPSVRSYKVPPWQKVDGGRGEGFQDR